MKVALAVNHVTPNIDKNMSEILQMIDDAAEAKADLILFPEAAPTGLINNDTPSHDLPLGQKIPGPITQLLSHRIQNKRIWIAIGLLERDKNKLYDSAILIPYPSYQTRKSVDKMV